MSSQEDYINVFNDLVNITDSAQFLQGVQKDPERILSAFKSLAERNHGFNDVSNQLHTVQQEIAKKDQIIISTANNLGEAQERIKSLEKKANTSSSKTQQTEVLRRLANAIESWQPQKCIQPQQVRSAPVPDTSTFCGDKAKFPTWKDGVLLKLTANSDHYPTEQAKMTYVYSMLDSDCQAHLHGFLNNGQINFSSLSKMMDHLTTLFDDPNRVRDAKARLHTNKQKNKPFSSWIAEIRRDAAISGYDKKPDILRDIVFLNLSLDLQRALVHERDIESLSIDAAIARLQDIDNRQRAFSDALTKNRPSRLLPPLTSDSYAADSPLTTTQGGDAMDLSATNFHGPLSVEEKDRRRRLGLCYYCGKGKHRAQDCSVKKAKQVISGRSADVVNVETSAEAGKV